MHTDAYSSIMRAQLASGHLVPSERNANRGEEMLGTRMGLDAVLAIKTATFDQNMKLTGRVRYGYVTPEINTSSSNR